MTPSVEDTTRDHEDDIAAIRQLIADVETGFNTNDAELLVSPFIRNGSAVNVAGVLLSGFQAMLESARDGLAGALRNQYARYELADVVFLRPDVAVAHKLARAVDAEGEPIDIDHTMIALYVMVREGGRWWVAARQNTMIQS